MRVVKVSTPLRINGQPLRTNGSQNPVAFGETATMVRTTIQKELSPPVQKCLAMFREMSGQSRPDYITNLRSTSHLSKIKENPSDIEDFINEVNYLKAIGTKGFKVVADSAIEFLTRAN